MIFFFFPPARKRKPDYVFSIRNGWVGGGGTLRNMQACEGAMRHTEAYISAPPSSNPLKLIQR